jgi:hypothetical protein
MFNFNQQSNALPMAQPPENNAKPRFTGLARLRGR